MKKILTLFAAAALFFSIGAAAHAARPHAQSEPQRGAFNFTTGTGNEMKRDGSGSGKPRPYPTPRPRRPGPRDEPESGDD